MRSSPEVPLSRIRRVRRDDVVRAAVTVIDREGHSAASIARIAEEAGTSKGTVLYHFRSRTAVEEAVVSALFADGASFMSAPIVAAGTLRERLHAYVDSNLRFIAEHAAHVRAVHQILANNRGRADQNDAVVWLRDMLADGQRAGEFDPDFDPHVLALTVRAVVDGASFHLTEHGDLDVDHYINQAVRLFDRATRAED